MTAPQSLSEEVVKLWSGWETRVLVLLSLLMQIILVIFGSRRKYTRIVWINLLLWLAYLIADWVATLALGTLARSRADSEYNSFQPNNVIHAFWAPFLLLHLGGPDTITAFSLEDNELWLRHFLEFVVQAAVAFYVFIPSWSNKTDFRFLAIPMFITGIIKYGERTLVLWFSSANKLKDFLRSSDDPGRDFAEIMEEVRCEERLKPRGAVDSDVSDHESIIINEDRATPPLKTVTVDYLVKAYSLFERFRCLYAGLILDHYDREKSYFLINCNNSAAYAFELVAIELGFMSDLLYTKSSTIYSRLGIFLRFISLFSHVSVSVAFLVLFVRKHAFSPIDISITCVLLLGAVFLEFYALILLLLSDWVKLWLRQRKLIPGDMILNKSTRWSGSMGQYNLLSFCLTDLGSKTARLQKLFGIKEQLEKHLYLTWIDMDAYLQDMIFKQVSENSNKIKGKLFNIKLCKELLAQRGDYELSKMCCHEELRWSTIEVDFDQSLLIWHIATDLCYYGDFGGQENATELPLGCKISRCLSDYMLYLLVVCPTMLPKGIGETRYRQTCADAMRFFKRIGFRASIKRKACNALLNEEDDFSLLEKFGDKSLSVLPHGCRLARQLQALTFPGDDDKRNNNIEQKWGMISKVWVEMLAYAANHCGWEEHGRQLMKGGELLTHVCLLMAHFGLSEQYQIPRQHFRRRVFIP